MLLDRRLLKHLGKAPALFLLTVLAGLLGGILIIAQAWQISQVTAAVFLDRASLQQVTPALWLLLVVLLARPLAQALGEQAAAHLTARLKIDLRDRLLDRQVSGNYWLGHERSGDLAETIGGGVDALDAYFSQYLPQLAQASVIPLIMLGVVAQLDPLSALVMILTAPLIPLFMVLLGRTAEGRTRRQFTFLQRMSAYFLDVIQGITTLKMLGRRDQAGRVWRVSERYRDVTLSVLRWTFLSSLALELIATISTAVLAVQIGLRLLSSGLTFQPAFFILLLAPEYYHPLRQLGMRFHAAMTGIAAAESIFGLLDEPQPANRSQPVARLPSEKSRGNISLRFENVSYTYPGRSFDALKAVDLSIPACQVTAVIGESGSGKSTILNLLLRLMDPDQGRIFANGIALGDISIETWRSALAWVPQQPTLFAGTLADNISLSRPEANEEDVRQAAEWAGLGSLLASLPDGLDTAIGEAGARLSGGEAQRVALARARLRGAPLWLLDEPTAHSDPLYEEWFAERLAEMRGRHTLIILAHHLQSAVQADQVIVLANGRVLEQGAPQALSRGSGQFERMLRAARGL